MSHRVKIELEIYEEIAVCMVTYVWLNCKLAKSGSTNYSRVSNNSTNVSSCQLCTAQIKRSHSIHILRILIGTKASKGVIPFIFWAFKLILKYQIESFHSHFEHSNWYKTSKGVIQFTCWAFKLILKSLKSLNWLFTIILKTSNCPSLQAI